MCSIQGIQVAMAAPGIADPISRELLHQSQHGGRVQKRKAAEQLQKRQAQLAAAEQNEDFIDCSFVKYLLFWWAWGWF